MNVPESHRTDRGGIAAVQALFASMEWLFREQPVSDFGIDAQVEVVTDGRATGELIALQIKSGRSFFRQTDGDGITFYGDPAHREYWLNHCLPVVVVLYDPESQKAYWQLVSEDSVIGTNTGWKLIVPWTNLLGVASVPALKSALEEHSANDPLTLLLRRLELDRPWMERLRNGDELLVDVDEWVNKSSGRGDFRLVTVDRDLNERIVHDWPFQIFPGAEYSELIPALFPWANLEVDDETYDFAEEELWQEEEGVWDSEDGQYIMVGDSFADWRAKRPSGLRPYETGDEVAKWRLRLQLAPLGEAFLTIHDFLMTRA